MALLVSACRPNVLDLLGGLLAFSSPDDPAAVTRLDGGIVQIDFGPVVVDATRSLTLASVSLAAAVTLGALTPIPSGVQPDPEFSLPFIPGSEVGTTPSDITVAFSPTSVGNKSADFQLVYGAPASQNVTFLLTGQGVADGLVVSPNPLDFGFIELNESHALSLTITNQGSLPATLTVSPLQGADAALFTLGAPAATALAPGASTTLAATFAPLIANQAGEMDTASFTIDGWSTTDPLTVTLTGTGVESWLEVTPLNFNYVQINHSFVKPAVLKNLSNYQTVNLVAPPMVTGSEFSLQSFAPNPIGPGQSLSIPVAFSPYGLGPVAGALLLTTDDPNGQHPVVPLQGYGGGPEIHCDPQLTFQPSLIGITQTLQVTCWNFGINIPDHPEITLQFSQSGVSAEPSVFKASFALWDGGVISDAGISLLAGQSTSSNGTFINVTFAPPDAGLFTGRLTVSSNDLNDADAGTILSGIGQAPGPCTLQVTPSQLSFGEVPKGDVGKMQFELRNVGQDYCLVTDVRLDSKSDPAFSLPVGLPSPQALSFVGNTGLPKGLPTSILLEAQFAPTTSKAASVGTVSVTAYDTPNLAIPMTGTSLAACLTIQPPSFDFGLLGFYQPPQSFPGGLCTSDSTTFTALNICAQPLTISDISVAAGPYAVPQFTLASGPPLPMVLPAGDQIAFAVGFTPDSIGKKVGDILVTSSDLAGTPYLVTVEGDPELTGTRTDTFTAPAPLKKVDLAWILDNDDDETTSIAPIGAILPQLIDALHQSGIDYQLAVPSTDTCNQDGADQGSFEPCDHCLSTAQSAPIFITPATVPDPATGLGDLFGGFALPARADCWGLVGDEHLFDTIAAAFSPGLLSGHNSGFIRPDAYLAILMANGDSEDDGANSLTTLSEAISIVKNLKPDPGQVSFSFTYLDGQTLVPENVGELVQATGGVAINIGVRNWESFLINLFTYGGGGQGFYTLASTPSDLNIQVSVNGVPTSSWVLNGNTLVLTGPAPAPGSIVSVTYDEGC